MISYRNGLEKSKPTIEGVIESSQFTLHREAGRGTWGTVYEATDNTTGQTVAVKVFTPTELARAQMTHRNLDSPFKAFGHEGEQAACAHIVPRAGHLDSSGRPFVVMPFYGTFLDKFLHEDEKDRRCFTNDVDRDKYSSLLRDVALGLAEMHSVRKRVHADIKPENIALDGNKALLTDLGTSICGTFGWTVSPRDNMGFVYTRAPESFAEGSRATSRSDVWGFGSLAYRFLTGKYIFEEEFDAEGDNLFRTHTARDLDEIVAGKLKNLPKEFKRLRPVLSRALSTEAIKRQDSGVVLADEISLALRKPNYFVEAWQAFKKVAFGTVAATVGGAAVYLALNLPSFESQKVPVIAPQVKGMLSLDSTERRFDCEQIINMPVAFADFMGGGYVDSLASQLSSDRTAAYLFSTYRKVQLSGRSNIDESYMEDLFERNATEKEKNSRYRNCLVPLRSIEKALKDLTDDSGRADLEDVLVYSIAGPEMLERLKRSSSEFNDYVRTVEGKGQAPIPVLDGYKKDFLLQWLAQIHRNYERFPGDEIDF